MLLLRSRILAVVQVVGGTAVLQLLRLLGGVLLLLLQHARMLLLLDVVDEVRLLRSSGGTVL